MNMPGSSTVSSTRSCRAALPSSDNTGATIKAICSGSASTSRFPAAKSWSDASPSPGALTRISPVAIHDAFAAARRQIEDHARIYRGEVKLHSLPDYGRIIRLFPKENYGFIATADNGEVYFHRNSVVGGAFDELAIGDEVRFVAQHSESAKGLQASTVSPVG